METSISGAKAATRVLFYTWMVVNVALDCYWMIENASIMEALSSITASVAVSLVLSVPAWIILLVLLESGLIEKVKTYKRRLLRIYICLLVIALLYGATILAFSNGFFTPAKTQDILFALAFSGGLFIASVVAMLLNVNFIRRYLYDADNAPMDKFSYKRFFLNQNTSAMFSDPTPQMTPSNTEGSSNKILIKSIITAAIILVMLIPTAFIQSLVMERQDRQKEVVNEISSKWAKPQTVSAPYLVVPYMEAGTKKQLIMLPEQLKVKGNITQEDRQRSIYKVLLYKTALNFTGNFRNTATTEDSSALLLNEAKLCFGLSDFRGIEDKMAVTFNNTAYTLQPGLANTTIDSAGLSVPVSIAPADLEKGISFNMSVALKGSSSLHFLPIASYSSYTITSPWASPSFDGNTLPAERTVNDSGFTAKWKFNAANLALTNIIKNDKFNAGDVAFGVSLVQPTGQYEQTMRSAKYAILIIGLTFVLFFVFELMQKKPVHPVQYALIGMALVIFYTLLLSISELVLFAYAYTIAAVATILLIALYAKAHFKNLRSPFIIGLLLTGLYGFIYVLISLEDTALLAGSIALFIVVAIIMYVTRKVNWYNPDTHATVKFQP